MEVSPGGGVCLSCQCSKLARQQRWAGKSMFLRSKGYLIPPLVHHLEGGLWQKILIASCA